MMNDLPDPLTKTNEHVMWDKEFANDKKLHLNWRLQHKVSMCSTNSNIFIF